MRVCPCSSWFEMWVGEKVPKGNQLHYPKEVQQGHSHLPWLKVPRHSSSGTRHARPTRPTTSNTEWELIALHAGLFDDVDQEITICPTHRFKLGLDWKPSRKCQHPLHPAASKRQPRRDRSIQASVSKEVFEIRNVLLPIGSGRCKLLHSLGNVQIQ